MTNKNSNTPYINLVKLDSSGMEVSLESVSSRSAASTAKKNLKEFIKEYMKYNKKDYFNLSVRESKFSEIEILDFTNKSDDDTEHKATNELLLYNGKELLIGYRWVK